jgi:hypothetical protein
MTVPSTKKLAGNGGLPLDALIVPVTPFDDDVAAPALPP